MFRENFRASSKLRLILFALLVFFLCGAPLAAGAAPTEVKFSWGENTDGLDVPGHIIGGALAIYDSEGALQSVSGDITEENFVYREVNYKIYAAVYSLEPGAYRWEGKSGDVVIGGGPVDVGSARLNLSLIKAYVGVKLSYDDGDERGVRLDLYDYSDTDKATPLMPYYEELFDSENPDLGVTERRYLVLFRNKREEMFDYRISPAEDVIGDDGKPVYIKEGKFAYVPAQVIGSALKRLMTASCLSYDGFNTGGLTAIPFPAIKTVIFNVTHGADLRFCLKTGGYYGPVTEFPRNSFTSGDDYDIYTFDIDTASGVLTSGYIFYEASGAGFIRDFMQVTPPRESVIPGDYTITVDLEKSDARDWSAVDYDANWQDADMYLNLSDDRYLEMRPDESFELRPLRVWQAVRDTVSNFHMEPDYHLELLGAPGGSATLDSINGAGTTVSNGVVEIEMTGGRGSERYKITGKAPGTAVIKITYDALINSSWQLFDVVLNEDGVGRHVEYPNHRKNTEIGQQLFYPSEPNCTAVVVVNVTENGAADSAGVSANIGEREFDTIYFADTQNSAVYTFAPTAAAGGDVNVRVHKPLHGEGVAWDEDWADYGGKAGGASFDITLYEGYNIVEVSADGAKKYHSIYAKPAKITVTNLAHPESDHLTVGDEVNINIKGLKTPVQKLGGIYNPGGGGVIYDVGGLTLEFEGSQYTIKSGVDLKYVVQEEETTLRNGRIGCWHYGSALGMHRFIGADVPPDLDADTNDGVYSTLPDITIRAASPEPDDPGDDDPGNNTDDETTIPVPGGSLTVSAPGESITVDPATGATILTDGGRVTTTTGEATVIVPPGTTIATDGTITAAEGGVLALPGAGGASSPMEIYIPAGTTIDPHTGVITIHAPSQAGGGAAAAPVILPGAGGKLDEEGNIPILVPDGSTIDPHTGLLTLRQDGRIILPGPNGKIDTGLTAGDPDGGIANDDVEIDAPKETTVRPDTGVVTLPDGRAFNPDGSRVTTGGGDPGDDDDLDDSNGGGGCVTGLLGTSAVIALSAAWLRRRKAR